MPATSKKSKHQMTRRCELSESGGNKEVGRAWRTYCPWVHGAKTRKQPDSSVTLCHINFRATRPCSSKMNAPTPTPTTADRWICVWWDHWITARSVVTFCTICVNLFWTFLNMNQLMWFAQIRLWSLCQVLGSTWGVPQVPGLLSQSKSASGKRSGSYGS